MVVLPFFLFSPLSLHFALFRCGCVLPHFLALPPPQKKIKTCKRGRGSRGLTFCKDPLALPSLRPEKKARTYFYLPDHNHNYCRPVGGIHCDGKVHILCMQPYNGTLLGAVPWGWTGYEWLAPLDDILLSHFVLNSFSVFLPRSQHNCQGSISNHTHMQRQHQLIITSTTTDGAMVTSSPSSTTTGPLSSLPPARISGRRSTAPSTTLTPLTRPSSARLPC